MPHEAAMKRAYRDALRGTWVGIVVNLLLGLGKIIVGVLGNCFALISDGMHSLSDLASSIGTLAGFRIAMKPPDDNHPYGHSRAESVIGAYVALGLGVAGAWVIVQAVGMIGRSDGAPRAFTMWAAAVSIAVKEALYQYKIRLGRRLASSSLIADAWDHRSDVLSSLAVLIGVALSRYAGWHSADEIAALFVGATLIWAAVVLLRDATHELMDRQQDDVMLAALRDAALAVSDVRAVEKLWVRKAGLEYLVDIHIEVDPDMTVRDSHAVAHRVVDHLLRTQPTIHQVLAHVEPHGEERHAGTAQAAPATPE